MVEGTMILSVLGFFLRGQIGLEGKGKPSNEEPILLQCATARGGRRGLEIVRKGLHTSRWRSVLESAKHEGLCLKGGTLSEKDGGTESPKWGLAKTAG